MLYHYLGYNEQRIRLYFENIITTLAFSVRVVKK